MNREKFFKNSNKTFAGKSEFRQYFGRGNPVYFGGT